MSITPSAPDDLYALMQLHETRQALAARASYSLLRITAAVPPENRSVSGAADAGQQASAWLAGSSTNPGRWTTRRVLVAELHELDLLLADLHGHLVATVDWLAAHLGSQAGGRSGPQHTIRVPRTLLAECTTLIHDLEALAPAVAA
ncbi:hypothetical protein [Cryptosporangium phraense]|uniref:Uncharacterized protein n=1 Tax=Cryptosporangium phraense TaxID=2593070 RepID=A0A545AY86_9ACTN|nr:hypothetical protein [Cryptosporangium phraense]TQS46304.1 hypothetical protein FL583_02605 [Cryptosporangium phraense]